MIQRPPRSTPFPYTTLFPILLPFRERMLAQLPPGSEWRVPSHLLYHYWQTHELPLVECIVPGRSEEHTSELQSRRDLVCRLLLEKKKPSHTRDVSAQKHRLSR